jgi:poly-beta-1,6-N-acetyl-D-glucosamine synthase
MYLGILAVALFLLSTAFFAAAGMLQLPTGWWLGLTGLFVVERMWTVRRHSWRAVVLAAPIVIEFGYDLFQQAVYLRAAIDMLFRRTADWHHASNPRTD